MFNVFAMLQNVARIPTKCNESAYVSAYKNIFNPINKLNVGLILIMLKLPSSILTIYFVTYPYLRFYNSASTGLKIRVGNRIFGLSVMEIILIVNNTHHVANAQKHLGEKRF